MADEANAVRRAVVASAEGDQAIFERQIAFMLLTLPARHNIVFGHAGCANPESSGHRIDHTLGRLPDQFHFIKRFHGAQACKDEMRFAQFEASGLFATRFDPDAAIGFLEKKFCELLRTQRKAAGLIQTVVAAWLGRPPILCCKIRGR